MDTVAVQLTGRGVGAIGVVLVAGSGAAALLAGMAMSERARRLAAGQMAHTALLHPQTKIVLDDAVLVRVAEERFEVHLHGGIAVIDAVLGALTAGGARVLSAEEARRMGLFGSG